MRYLWFVHQRESNTGTGIGTGTQLRNSSVFPTTFCMQNSTYDEGNSDHG